MAADFSLLTGAPTVRLARQELPRPRVANKLAIAHDHLSPAEDCLWCSTHPRALVHGVVDAVMELRCAEGPFEVGVPDSEIGVASDRDRSLVRVETENLRR